MPVVNIEESLRQKLGQNGVNSLTSLINESQEIQKVEILTFVEEKFERRLSEEIRVLDKSLSARMSALEVSLTKENAKLKVEVMSEIAKLRTDMTEGDAKTRIDLINEIAKLRADNAKTKTEIIKWMFIFWVGQLGAMLGVLFTFLK